jgi:hypothetical protein
MNRSGFLKSLCAGVAGLVSNSCFTTIGQSAGKRRDVLFIAIDGMNDWTTCSTHRTRSRQLTWCA